MEPSLLALSLALHDVAQLLAPRGWRRVGFSLDAVRAGATEADLAATEGDATSPSPALGDKRHQRRELAETLSQIDASVKHEGIPWSGSALALERAGASLSLHLEAQGGAPAHTTPVDARLIDGICVVSDALLDAYAAAEPRILERQRELARATRGLPPKDLDVLGGRAVLGDGASELRVRTEPIAHFDASTGELGWAWAYEELAPHARIVTASRDAWRDAGRPGFVARPGLFATDPVLAHQLASLAAVGGEAMGVYCFAYEGGAYYLAILSTE